MSFSQGDKYVLSVGKNDRSLIIWRVRRNLSCSVLMVYFVFFSVFLIVYYVDREYATKDFILLDVAICVDLYHSPL